jgi:hypothetical protein
MLSRSSISRIELLASQTNKLLNQKLKPQQACEKQIQAGKNGLRILPYLEICFQLCAATQTPAALASAALRALISHCGDRS